MNVRTLAALAARNSFAKAADEVAGSAPGELSTEAWLDTPTKYKPTDLAKIIDKNDVEGSGNKLLKQHKPSMRVHDGAEPGFLSGIGHRVSRGIGSIGGMFSDSPAERRSKAIEELVKLKDTPSKKDLKAVSEAAKAKSFSEHLGSPFHSLAGMAKRNPALTGGLALGAGAAGLGGLGYGAYRLLNQDDDEKKSSHLAYEIAMAKEARHAAYNSGNLLNVLDCNTQVAEWAYNRRR
jgi:hypothetical protein